MKPLHLKMRAFGSYVEEEICFSDLKRGLFLISGETGAGKTMIFDAIAFALYGKTSGGEREPIRMHCDRVSPAVDTEVTLIFAQSGREYTVRRTLHFSKKRGKEEYNEAKQDAVLTEPDGVTVKGQEKVTARCTELLGMDVEQFRKIVMLAQGEFREFLRAGSDRKNEILGRLFDNSAFTRYQTLLYGARGLLLDRRRDHQEKLMTLIEEGFTEEEERSRYHPESVNFLENLRALADGDRQKLAETEKRKVGLQEELRKLNSAFGAAEGVNHDLKELQEKRARAEELDALEAEKKALARTVAMAETVLHTVRPKLEAADQAVGALEKAESEIRDLEETLQKCAKALEQAKARTAEDEKAVSRVDALKSQISRIREQLPKYEDLGKEIQAARTAEAAEKKARETRETKESARQALQEAQTLLSARLEALRDVDHQAEEAAREEEAARKALDILTGRDGLVKGLRSVRTEEKKAGAEEDKLADLARAALLAEEEHHALYLRFIAGQAGLLAEDLRREIRESGQAACPVCGTVHRQAGDHFAAMAEGTPVEEEVRAAQERARQAEALRKQQETALEQRRKEIENRKNDLLRRADPLFPGCLWDQLADRAFLENAERELTDRAAAAARALEASRKNQLERDALLKQEKEQQQTMEDLLSAIEAARQQESAAHAALAAAGSAAEVLKKALPLPSAEEAQKQITLLASEQAALQKEIDAHLRAEKEAQAAVTNTEGMLEGKRKEIPLLRSVLLDARQEAESSLRENGFTLREEAFAALAPAGPRAEEWIRLRTRELHDYESDRKTTRERIAELEKKTAGKTFVDLSLLEERIYAKGQEQQEADREHSAGVSALQAHQRILDRAAEYKKKLASTDEAWRRLDALGLLAAGSTAADGGRLSFDRHVMGAVFREILEMANRRIDLMSGGQYELIHKREADRKNVKAGLEIEVRETGTGNIRPSAQLSGGEGFYASLALALGLSDVVQMHAGGKQLDALFIDEGFGTLSADVLDRALKVLDELTMGDRLVGIISHVEKLDESIPQKLRVVRDENGSHVLPELS